MSENIGQTPEHLFMAQIKALLAQPDLSAEARAGLEAQVRYLEAAASVTAGPVLTGPVTSERDTIIATNLFQTTLTLPTPPDQQQRLDRFIETLQRLAHQGRQAVPDGEDDPLQRAAREAGVMAHARAFPQFAEVADALRLVMARAMMRWQVPAIDGQTAASALVRQSLIATALAPLVLQRVLLWQIRGEHVMQALSSASLTQLVLDERVHFNQNQNRGANAEMLLHIRLIRALADPQYDEGCMRLLDDLCDPQRGAPVLAAAYLEYCQGGTPDSPVPTPDVLRLLAAGALIFGAGVVIGGTLVAVSLTLARHDTPPESLSPSARDPDPPSANRPTTKPSGRWSIPVTSDEWRTELRRCTGHFGQPDGYWCYVRRGTYPIGGWERDQARADRRLNSFWIARLPITVAQFTPFIAVGYADSARRWWTPHGWQWKREYNRTQPYRWREPPFNSQADQPVTGVTWYEAVAFTTWLTEQLADDLPRGYVIRLPTEAQWEAAAACDAAGHRHPYPWGEAELSPDRAVYNRSWDDGPPLVGSCPTGMAACGALDMVGTVWEWCSSRYNAYPQGADEIQKDVTRDTWDIPVRGGSWGNTRTYVRCAARDRYRPHLNGRGLRVVFSPRVQEQKF